MSNTIATLRRRIPDLVAVSLLLAGGLFVGFEILDWYRSPEPRLAAPPSAMANLNTPGEAADLEFGDLPVAITRMTHVGVIEDARTALADLLRRAVSTALPLSDDELAERNLLFALSRRTPFEEQRDAWRVYSLDDQFATMVVARPAAEAGVVALPARSPELAPGGLGNAADLASTDLAGWRVVAIGMLTGGFPTAPATDGEIAPAWTLYVFRGTGGANGVSAGAVSPGDAWPRPVGSHRTMSVRDRTGGRLTALHGSGTAKGVGDFYAPLFEVSGYVPDPGWRNEPHRVWGRFRRTPHAGDSSITATVELLVMAMEGGRWTAILTETLAHPASTTNAEGEGAPQNLAGEDR
jgi:hypothetical protein